MATRYLQLDWKSSTLFEWSKDKKDGFEEHKKEDGTVDFREYWKKGVTGELLNAGVRDSKIGQQLNLAFKVDEDVIITKFGLYDKKGQVDNTYAESIIAHLGNLKKGEVYTMFPYNLTAETQKKWDEEKDDREVRSSYYDRRAVSFKQNGKKVNTFLSYKEGESNSIPRLEWKEKTVGGVKKNRPTAVSLEVKDDFLVDALNVAINGHLAYESNSSYSPPQAEPIKQENPKSAPNKEPTTVMGAEKSNLPF